MEQSEWHKAADLAYGEEIRGATLSELEDVYAHLDRRAYPQRLEAVRLEIDRRLRDLDSEPDVPEGDPPVKAGLWRRLWAGLLNLFVHALALGALYVIGTTLLAVVGSFGASDGPAGPPMMRPRPSGFQQVLGGIDTGSVGGLLTTSGAAVRAHWPWIGLVLLGVAVYRGLLTVPGWIRSGDSPGMREMGIRIVRTDGGRLSPGQSLVRFVGQYVMGVLTLGLSALWMAWDAGGRTLHDKLAGTRVIQIPRTWEKPADERIYE
ncbi:MAG: RDD family protein [Candidatus Latescibacteria bacterium]|jgi:uncharacterized RDD family membrane protein YckC|nr:RDD family protein [Candidatus Latescibacterota bacterium]